MVIGQFYRVSVSKQTSNKIAGGTQDNGGFAYFNDWNIYHGGDGMESVIDPNNDNKVYGFMQSGQTLLLVIILECLELKVTAVPRMEIDNTTFYKF